MENIYANMTNGERLHMCDLQHAAVADKNIYLLASYLLAFGADVDAQPKEGEALAKAQEMRRHLLKLEQAQRGASHNKLSTASSAMAKAIERILTFAPLTWDALKSNHASYDALLEATYSTIKNEWCSGAGALNSPEGYLPRLQDFPKNPLKVAAKAASDKAKAATVAEVEAPAPQPKSTDFQALLQAVESALLEADSLAKADFAYNLAVITGATPTNDINKALIVAQYQAALKMAAKAEASLAA